MKAFASCLLRLGLMLGSGALLATEAPGTRAIDSGGDPSIAAKLSTLRGNLDPIQFERVSPPSSAANAYFEFYGLSSAPHAHHFGTFHSGRHVLAMHAFVPEAPRGTVILLHGFYDHVGTFASTIHHLLELGFAVAAYDQPGHGLSSGPRASIETFAVYTSVFEEFLRLVRAHLPPPYQVLAHSTGAAIVVEHLLTHEDPDIEKVVLVAPLVRSAHWHLSTMFSPVVDVFVDDVPRVFRDNSSNEQFLEFVRQDPLQARHTSLAWFDALVDWNERIEGFPSAERDIVVIQGNRDSIVDWEYNLEFIGKKFPRARIEIIDGGQHQLLNEAPTLRAKVLRLVDGVLSGQYETELP